MTESAAAELCRLTVRAPAVSFEIAVPCDIPLAELVPTFLLYAERDGEDLDENGLDHSGWVLQRLGSPPLDEDGTCESLELFDGDVLYLRERRDQMPPVHFDDLVDGVATGMAERPDRWGAAQARRWLTGAGAAALFAALVPVALLGFSGPGAAVAAGTAVLMLLATAAAGRALGSPATAAATGTAAVLFMAFAGACAPDGDPGAALAGARLLAGAAAGTGAAVLAVAAAAGCVPFFTGVGAFSVFGAAAGALLLFWGGVPLPGVAGLLAGAAVLLGTFAPALAFRMSGMRLPPLPSGADELQEHIAPHPARDVLDRTRRADSFQTALLAAVGAVCAAALAVLALHPGWLPTGLGAALCLVLVLQARGLGGAWQRACLLVPGHLGALALALGAAALGGTAARLAVFGMLLAGALALAVAAWAVPGNRMLPHWGRAGELLHSAAAIVLVILVPANLGLFGLLRGIGG
ncbi:type VII secretion integral membrane protein EccD [Nocardiopsis suaedae]|uniref:Type VII secretion integral membrane protein EccD n=1 Tax=Nocardiopsis suaedae TaxID=3018444 RepID=A0ABT4TKM0_9ACTN|nr:type VII secretion integral membrane protein EccD [Nocardiopsis suaedae]MDA2805262.1 type VII secretion integral membrane protein EccD [Nocardiopsis suaedae]